MDKTKAVNNSWGEILEEIERRLVYRLYIPSAAEPVNELMEFLFSSGEFSRKEWGEIVRIVFDRQPHWGEIEVTLDEIAYPSSQHYDDTVEEIASILHDICPSDYIVHGGHVVCTFDPDGEEHPFDQLGEQLQDDLIGWANIKRDDVTLEMLDELAEMFNDGRFAAWDCPECGERCYAGEPENWQLWQGVNNVDYTSCPGNGERYTAEYLENMCDGCRRGSWQ